MNYRPNKLEFRDWRVMCVWFRRGLSRSLRTIIPDDATAVRLARVFYVICSPSGNPDGGHFVSDKERVSTQRPMRKGALHLIVKIIASFLFLTTPSSSPYASDSRIDFSQLLRSLPPIKAATVILLDPTTKFRQGLSETDFRVSGCKYFTQDASQITSLVDLISHSAVRASAAAEYPFETREGVFLTLVDDTEVKFLLSREFPNVSTVEGTLRQPTKYEAQRFVVSKALLHNLYDWAKRAEDMPESVFTFKRRQACGEFIKNLKSRLD